MLRKAVLPNTLCVEMLGIGLHGNPPFRERHVNKMRCAAPAENEEAAHAQQLRWFRSSF
jgi:hypothetical protein